MVYGKVTLMGMVCLILAFCALGQDQVINVFKANSGEVAVDGKLDEGIWLTARSSDQMQGITPGFLTVDGGSADDENDRSAEFVMLWDEKGVYCGAWNKDDINSTPNSKSLTTIVNAWMDDSHEWFIDQDFDDAWGDVTSPYYGNYGWQFYTGFNMEFGQVSHLYNCVYPIPMTVDEARQNGFELPYSTTDGNNFQSEAFWSWTSPYMGAIGTPSAGKAIAFNLAVNDNDGSDGVWMRWSGMDVDNFQGWGKATLVNERPTAAGIRPVAALLSSISKDRVINAVYDIQGRKVNKASLLQQKNGIYFVINKEQKKGMKTIELK